MGALVLKHRRIVAFSHLPCCDTSFFRQRLLGGPDNIMCLFEVKATHLPSTELVARS